MNRAALSTLIAQLGGVPSVERMAILQEALDAILDRIESLEVQARSVRLQQRPFRALSGKEGKLIIGDWGGVATMERGARPRQKNLSAAGGKSATRTPVKRFDTEHRNKSKV